MRWLAALLALCASASALRCEPTPPDILPVQLIVDGQVQGDALIAEDGADLLILSGDLKPFGAQPLCPDGAWQPVPYPARLDRSTLQVTLTLPTPPVPPRAARAAQPTAGAVLRGDVQLDSDQGAAARAQLSWQVNPAVQLQGEVSAGKVTSLNLRAQYGQVQPSGARLSASVEYRSLSAEPWQVRLTRTAPRAQPAPLILNAEQPGTVEVHLGPALLYSGRYAAGRTTIDTASWPPVSGRVTVTMRERTGTRTLSLPVDLRRTRPVPHDVDAALTVQFGADSWQASGTVTASPSPGMTVTLSGAVGRDPGAAVSATWLAADGSQWSAQASLDPQQAQFALTRQADTTLKTSVQVTGGQVQRVAVGASGTLSGQVTGQLDLEVERGKPALRGSVQVQDWPAPQTVTTASVTVQEGRVTAGVRLAWTPSPDVRVTAQSGAPHLSASVTGRAENWTVTATAATDRTPLEVRARGPADVTLQVGTRTRVAVSSGVTLDGHLVPSGGPAVLMVHLGVPDLPVTLGDLTLPTGADGRVAFSVVPEQAVTLTVNPDHLPLGWTVRQSQWTVQLGPEDLQTADLTADLSREPLRRLPVPPGTAVQWQGQPLTLMGDGYVLAPDARDGDVLDATLPGGQQIRCTWSSQEELTCAP